MFDLFANLHDPWLLWIAIPILLVEVFYLIPAWIKLAWNPPGYDKNETRKEDLK